MIEEFKKCKTVKEWNAVFDKYKYIIGTTEMAKITTSGLIVQVLGKDRV